MNKQQKRPYSIEPYNEQWPIKFEIIKNELEKVFKDKALRIEHVGSTSVPDMKAKPMIDVLMIVPSLKDLAAEKSQMEARGYIWQEDYIGPNTLVFVKQDDEGRKTENIHACEIDSPKVDQFLVIRDYLRTHPDQVKEYEALKESLYTEFPDDYPSYRQGKNDFLEQLKTKAYQWHATLNNNHD